MAVFTLKKGSHYHRPLWRVSTPHWGVTELKRTVTFDSACAYELADYNQGDVNKLFGLFYGFTGVHKYSARFGWRWSRTSQKIELLAYVYNNGTRNWDEQLRFPVIAQIDFNQGVECSLTITPTDYVFRVRQGDISFGGPVIVPHDKLPSWGFKLLPYFGGVLAAPQTMKITLS